MSRQVGFYEATFLPLAYFPHQVAYNPSPYLLLLHPGALLLNYSFAWKRRRKRSGVRENEGVESLALPPKCSGGSEFGWVCNKSAQLNAAVTSLSYVVCRWSFKKQPDIERRPFCYHLLSFFMWLYMGLGKVCPLPCTRCVKSSGRHCHLCKTCRLYQTRACTSHPLLLLLLLAATMAPSSTTPPIGSRPPLLELGGRRSWHMQQFLLQYQHLSDQHERGRALPRPVNISLKMSKPLNRTRMSSARVRKEML